VFELLKIFTEAITKLTLKKPVGHYGQV